MKIFTAHIAGMYYRYTRFLGAMLMVALMSTSFAMSIPTLNLRSTNNFVILAGTAITGIPPVAITGDVGLSPAAGSNITGFDGSNVNGILYVVAAGPPAGSVPNATLLTTAKGDLTIAYNDAAGRTPVPTGDFLNPGGGNIGGLNLAPGLYKFTSEAAITGSDVTLTGSATDVWIFQIGTSLDVGSGIHVILAGGAQAANIFWQVGSSATLGTYSVFKGTILASIAISLGTGASMDGRALAFSAAVTMASGVTTTKPVPVSTAPIFSVNPTQQLAFGNVNDGLNKRDSATVTNIGTANLIISSVTSSNTLFTVTPITGTIAPHSTKKFYITFAPLTDGLQNGFIRFNHNAANAKDSIGVSGTGVSPQFSVDPKILNFGEVNNDITKMDSVIVENKGTSDLIITSFTSSNTHFTITDIGATIAPGASQKFYITFTPLTSGLQDGYIRFNFNATNAKDSVHVTGTGVGNPVFPTFSVNPSNLNFEEVNSGTTKMDSVTVTNTGTANLVISGISSSNVYYLINPRIATITPNASKKFYITFAPLILGLQDGYIRFNHNATSAKDSIPVTGTGVGNSVAPKFSASTLNLDFGTVFVGTLKQKSVNVTNTGASALAILDISSTDQGYTITPIIGTIVPHASLEFFITFAPTVVGQVDAKIIFYHNAGIDTINVTGKGLDATIPIITIETARELPIGTEFIIEGIVTRTLGSYTRIQDQTGAITIRQTSGEFFNEVENFDIQMADMVRIQGRIPEQGFLKIIDGNDLTGHQRLSRLNELPTPVKVTLSELANNGEQYESRLITLENLTIASGGDITFNILKTYQVTDASDNTNTVVIRIGNSADTDMDDMPFIGTSVTFEGVLSQSSLSDASSGYQLFPVLPTDLLYVPTGILETVTANQYSLSDNYPNPFNSSTTIQYGLGIADFVSLKVFNVLGKEVTTLVNGFQEAGTNTVSFSAVGSTSSLGSGVYFYRLEVGTFVSTKRMILVK